MTQLARNTESSIKEEVWRALAKAKYEAHSSVAAKRAFRRNDLLARLRRLLKDETGKKLRDKDLTDIIEQTEELERDTELLETIFK